MLKEHEDIIKNSISENFRLRERFNDFFITSKNQFMILQLDLLKTVSSIVVAVLSVGYLFNKISIDIFSLLAFSFSGLVLILFLSYIRETVDNQCNQLLETKKYIEKETDESSGKALESLKKDDASLFFEYNKKKISNENVLKGELVYIGEISLFFCVLFYFLREQHFLIAI